MSGAPSNVETEDRQRTQHEASASSSATPEMLSRTENLRRAFISLCCVDLVRPLIICRQCPMCPSMAPQCTMQFA